MAQVIGRNLIRRRRNSSSEFIAHMQKSAPKLDLVNARFKLRADVDRQADSFSNAFTRTSSGSFSNAFTRTSSGSGIVNTKSLFDFAVVNTATRNLSARGQRFDWIVFPSSQSQATTAQALVPHIVVSRSIDCWGSMISDGTYAAIELRTRAHTGSAIDEYGNFKTSRMKDQTQTFMFGQL
ncbi:hypothetical protein GUITHDRAFT_133520 [Guillardia theta CCMP2712]|uniref:Uncharacterized protein n=1 Tax=Guillardia theta (strain CCMP2712) TaxID=905079 RepID=L1JVM1_GUITC|nr:hypothetical protein GUITHDRAFT_133520 [Guillardia theta CCMP2712]EKX52427.1 hypothetical protein GUITHDRAFT_133520 [Guillardia theta CCMP2712]|eukprot:XP_005839407.1 hypothetical protein GUITHDRAFT_133520 [Guillardia theta CCMP2712]